MSPIETIAQAFVLVGDCAGRHTVFEAMHDGSDVSGRKI
jgi:hypothetical protein